MNNFLRVSAAWLALQLTGGPAGATVNKCTDAAGKVTYQTVPCPDASSASSLPVGAQAAPTARSSAAPSRSSQRDAWSIVTQDGLPEAPDARRSRRPADAGGDESPRRAEPPAMPEPPRVRLSFELLSTEGQRLAWTNSGPKDGRRMEGAIYGGSMAEGGYPAIALHESSGEAYTLEGNGGTLAWLPKGLNGPRQQIKPPARLPALSWASSLAWDAGHDVLAVASTGGEGYFYRYDTRSHTWLDARSMKDRDLLALTFDAVNKRFVGITEALELLTFNDQGDLQQVHPLAGRLPGLPGGASHVPGLALSARAGVVAIVAITRASVTHIWTYEQASDRVQLTFKSTIKTR